MSIIKSFLYLLLLAIASGLPLQASALTEEILSYDVKIAIATNGELTISETIKVASDGRDIKRGIYRDFPTLYKDRLGHSVRVDFTIDEVQRDGRTETYHTENVSNGVRVYFGHPKVLLPPGEHTYFLKFRTNRQLGFFEKEDELYFNAIGQGWKFTIGKARVEVALPQGVDVSTVKVGGFLGYTGQRGNQFSANKSDGTVSFELLRSLAPYEGFTILLSWPKGFVVEPDSEQKAIYFFQDNLGSFVGGIGLIALFVYYFLAWHRVGRDPVRGVVYPQYSAPKGIKAYELPYILRMKYDRKCFACLLTELAVSGFLKIEQEAGGFFGKGSFTIECRTGDDSPLDRVEKSVVNSLFPLSRKSGAALKLIQENHTKIGSALERLKSELSTKHLGKSFQYNSGYSIVGWVLSILIIFSTEMFSPGSTGIFSSVVPTVLAFVIFSQAIIFGYLLKARTQPGRKLLDQIEGYKMYLSVAERDEFAKEYQEVTPEVYEKHLPYAMALGVEKEWANNLATHLERSGLTAASYHPVWYSGHYDAAGFHGFSSSLGSSLGDTIASSSSAPGSSSGGSGGGSSGGGGGGGGGGGW